MLETTYSRAATITTPVREQTSTEKINTLANVLDEMEPTWFQKVDLDDFNLFDGTRCILSYTFGDYFEGEFRVLVYMGYETGNPDWHGTDYSYAGCFACREKYENLWIAAIKERRAA